MATTRRPTLEVRVREARRIMRRAITDAATMASDPSKHRSTRSRAAYKLRSDALAAALRALDGNRRR